MAHYFLLIDTSTEACSVALGADDGTIITQEIAYSGRQHSALIADYTATVLRHLPDGATLSAVGIAEGPGSYTGLRIAASFAKALCMTMDIPLISTTTPALMVYRCLEIQPSLPNNALLMPMIDARRMEVYTALYDTSGKACTDIQALILEDNSALTRFLSPANGRPLYFFGDGAAKADEIISHAHADATQINDVYPEAQAMLKRIIDQYYQKEFCDIAYWTPFYLKEYEAKKSVNKVLGETRTK